MNSESVVVFDAQTYRELGHGTEEAQAYLAECFSGNTEAADQAVREAMGEV